MNDRTLNGAPRAESPTPRQRDLSDDSHRRNFVGTMERIYGPAIVGTLFALLLQTDPALEVIVASFSNFAEHKSVNWETENAVVFFFWIILRVTCLAAVPAAVITASYWALRGSGCETSGAGRFLPRFFGAIAFGGYAWALYQGLDFPLRCAPEFALNNPKNPLTCELARSRFAMTLAGFTALFALQLWLYDGLARLLAKGRAAWRFGLAFLLAALVLYFMVYPLRAVPLGALGISGGLFAIYAFAFAGLTVVSARYIPYRMPLILGVIWLALVTSGPEQALVPVTAVLLAGFGAAFANATDALLARQFATAALRFARTPLDFLVRLWRIRLSHVEVFGLVLAVLSGIVWVIHARVTTCESLSGCNRVLGVAAPAPVASTPGPAFKAWGGPDKPRITLVAAQGGGLYAAYHAAYFLAARADTDNATRDSDPAERTDHAGSLFAVSGVSGGSVGAGIYWAIRKSGLCDRSEDHVPAPDCHREAVREILERDYLTPVLTALYTRDALDSFLPISAAAPRPIDRGRVLESELNRAVNEWSAKAAAARGDMPEPPRDLLLTPLAATWVPGSGLPLLLMNSVDVADGDRVVLSPLENIGGGTIAATKRLHDGNGLTLANAMVASARYPMVTPPLRLLVENGEDPKTIQLTDGGFFDASGLDTVVDVIGDIKGDFAGEIEVILMEVPDPEVTDGTRVRGTLGSPVSAFLGAWRSRRDMAKARFRKTAAETYLPDGLRIKPCIMSTKATGDISANFTVSWFLSRTTFGNIARSVDGETGDGDPGDGDAAPADHGLVCDTPADR